MDVNDILQQYGDAILAQAEETMHRRRQRHYEEAGPEQVRQRLKALFVLTARAVRERNLGPMLAHADAIAKERYAAGYDLSEVQTAFNVLEEAIWKHLEKTVDRERLGEALGLVSTVLGAGKDLLARTYVSLATKTKTPSLDLRELFSGTERT
jgi:hypothetical protein